MSKIPDANEIREHLLRAEERGFFLGIFQGIEARRDLQGYLAKTRPAMNRYDVERDDTFWTMLYGARIGLVGEGPDGFEASLMALSIQMEDILRKHAGLAPAARDVPGPIEAVTPIPATPIPAAPTSTTSPPTSSRAAEPAPEIFPWETEDPGIGAPYGDSAPSRPFAPSDAGGGGEDRPFAPPSAEDFAERTSIPFFYDAPLAESPHAEKPAAPWAAKKDATSEIGITRLRLFLGQDTAPVGLAPSLLGPAPRKDCRKQDLSAWLGGEIDSGDLAIRLSEAIVERMAEENEAELVSNPESFLGLEGMSPRRQGQLYPEYGAWLAQTAKAYDLPDLDLSQRFQPAVETVITQWYPERPKRLNSAGAQLVVGVELKKMISLIQVLEDRYLEEAGIDGADVPDVDLRGSIHPLGRLRPGLCFERAAVCHFAFGMEMPEALALAVVELRCAQAMRAAPDADQDEVFSSFDRRFLEDCFADLSHYRVSDPDTAPSF